MEIDSTDRIRPKYKACFFLIFPAGIGLRQVLLISASKSDSYHMFKAPAAPDPIATASKDIKEEFLENAKCINADMHDVFVLKNN